MSTHPATPLITVEILNAQELAARESWAARRFGGLVPRWVGREVAARAAAQIAEQLAEQGVRAVVRVVDPPDPAGETPPVVDADRAIWAEEEMVEVATVGVRDVHLAVSAIPFDMLDRVPPARAVRAVHDRIAGGVYDAVTAVNRVVGDVRRRRPG